MRFEGIGRHREVEYMSSISISNFLNIHLFGLCIDLGVHQEFSVTKQLRNMGKQINHPVYYEL